MRSLFLKIENFALDVHERESDLIFLTEVWEKLENKKHQFRLEEMLEMSGIKYISTPAQVQRGGVGLPLLSDWTNFQYLNSISLYPSQ